MTTALRLLLMDDDVAQARLVQRALTRAGYQVDLAHDGDAGLACCRDTRYDVLLVDHRMPGKDGLDVLRRLAAQEALPPTIMVTGHGDEGIAVEAMKLGAGDYIVKDTDGQYLTLLPAVLERVLQQQQLLDAKRQAEAALQETLATLEERVQARTAELQQVNLRLRAQMSERQRAEEALVRLSRRHKLILDSAGEGIYGVDWQGRTTFVNPAAASMLGWDTAALIGRPLQEVLEPSAHATFRVSFQDGQVLHASETAFRRQDGSSFPVEYTSTPLREGNEVIGAVVMFKDITARKHAEREMQRADRLALVGQLASGLAHEIGTPLNVIAGNAELLRMQWQEQGTATGELDAIITHTDRITRLIEQLLTFARAQPHPMLPLALPEPLNRALRLLEARFQREAITVEVDIPPDLPLVRGAADQLEQVCLNVLVNAWHAMPRGGTLTIRALPLAAGCVRLTCQDSGWGIAPEDLAHVFELFYSTKGDKGTGLGLAICKQIIDNHGGTIRLDSVPQQGTTVTIDLPCAEARP